MSGYKAVPAAAESTKSYEFFRETCQEALDARAKELGKAPVKFDPSKLSYFNRSTGDGKVELSYEEPGLDFGVSALLLWKSHELLLRSAQLSSPDKSRPLAGKFLEDAISFTRKIAGNEEFEGQQVEDGVADPRLKGKHGLEAFKIFDKECRAKFDEHGRAIFGAKLSHLYFDPNMVRLENSSLHDGLYNFMFENRANQFFCEGQVDSSHHLLGVRGGHVKDYEKIGSMVPVRIHNACSMTQDLLGPEELVNPQECKDYSLDEDKRINYISLGLHGALASWMGYSIYKSYTKPTGWLGRLLKLPFLRNLNLGVFAYLGYDTLASNFVDSESPWRKYGSPTVGVVGLAAPELAKTALAQRVLASPALQRLSTGVAGRVFGFAGSSRLGLRLALVWGFNKLFQLGIGSDYQASVNKRVTDLIYDKHVYELDGWDFLVIPLAVKGVRASARFIAPDAMNWAVMKDNEDLREDIYQEDEKNSEQAEDFLRNVLPHFLHAENSADRSEMLFLLRSKVELSEEDIRLGNAYDEGGLKAMKAAKSGLSEEEAETVLRRYLAHQTQEIAKALVFIDRPLNNWARDAFDSEGRLLPGDESAQKLQDRWPPPTKLAGQ